ncbi:GGDEF domain-containing protein, partial [Magnetococcales bacterium HHB-1]
PDDILLSPTRTNENIYTLLSGEMRIHLESKKMTPVTHIRPGECVGEMSVIECAYPSAFVIATQPSRVLTLNQEVLWSLVNHSHQICRNLLFTLSNRMRNNNSRIVEGKKRQQHLEEVSKIDPLTGLYNRRWLNRILNRTFQRNQESFEEEEPLQVILLDVDLFKAYNDQHGHIAGDIALKALATAMTNNLRPDDLAARYGGEEFALLLPQTTLSQAKEVAERLRQAVEEMDIIDMHGTYLPHITISLGIASNQPQIKTSDQLLIQADQALYHAKAQGRNRVCCIQDM